MSIHREYSDAEVIVVKEKCQYRNRATSDNYESRLNNAYENSQDAELIVLDSVDSDSTSSVEEIPLESTEKASPIMVCLSESGCSPESRSEVTQQVGLSAVLIDQATEESRLRDEVQRLLYQVNRLKEENVKLQGQWEKLQNAKKEDGPNDALVTITFKCGAMAKKYRGTVKRHLKKILAKESKKGSVVVKSIQEEKFCNNEKDDDEDLFIVDTSSKHDSQSQGRWNVPPLYHTSFEKPLQKTVEVITPLVKLRSTVCFNCEGDHTLSDCTQVWNHARIVGNRKLHFRSTVKSARYHVDKETSGKYRPGEISEELRSALNLKPGQVPTYIYRMRILGYPPGWMKEAQIESSGLIMYDSEGKAIVDDNVEDGEVETSSVRVQYDPKKLVSFPGFNVPLPDGVRDESSRLGFPPMQLLQLRSEVEKSMKPPEAKAFRKRKLSPVGNRNKKAKLDPNRIEDDMDIESTEDGAILNESDEEAKKCIFVPPLPLSDPARPPPPPTTAGRSRKRIDARSSSDTDDSLSQENSRSLGRGEPPHPSSPSLTDLEAAKNKLMEELGKVSDDRPVSGSPQLPAIQSKSPGSRQDSATRNCSLSDDHSDSEGAELDRSASLSVTPGTPVLFKHSPFSALPDSSSFSLGITEHACFENLPDSTGQYEKMRQVLGKIRDIQKEQQ